MTDPAHDPELQSPTERIAKLEAENAVLKAQMAQIQKALGWGNKGWLSPEQMAMGKDNPGGTAELVINRPGGVSQLPRNVIEDMCKIGGDSLIQDLVRDNRSR
jgi:hypothetical protein